jgi:hypothetical protein
MLLSVDCPEGHLFSQRSPYEPGAKTEIEGNLPLRGFPTPLAACRRAPDGRAQC